MTECRKPLVAVMMGSKNDLPVLKSAFQTFEQFGISYAARIMSAHRTPSAAADFAINAESAGIKVIICAAGMAAHLSGVVAAHTTLPVIGLPVAAVTAGKTGGKNAALYAISILALSCPELARKLKEFRKEQTAQAMKADEELQQELKTGLKS
jgi:5-(carboxyamino)imidazole ribonucleotide mutase